METLKKGSSLADVLAAKEKLAKWAGNFKQAEKKKKKAPAA